MVGAPQKEVRINLTSKGHAECAPFLFFLTRGKIPTKISVVPEEHIIRLFLVSAVLVD